MTYGVIICTKCRKQAQIIEIGSSKTTRCQICNASLMTRKLRIFFSSEDLAEVISVRTQIQAQITEKGTYPMHGGKEDIPAQYQVFGTDIDERTACMIDDRKVPKKKKADEMVLEILLSNNGKMQIDELKKAAKARDIDEDRFEDILKRMADAGEIYSPSRDTIKAVI